jgi:transcriptional regulator with XRE-family HTH domain
MEFRDKLRRAMGDVGMGVSELARALGKSEQSVSRWLNPPDPEKAKPPKAESLLPLARTLGVTVDYLIDPEREETDMPDWNEDEKTLVKVFRASRLTIEAALRRLMEPPKEGETRAPDPVAQDNPRPTGAAVKSASRTNTTVMRHHVATDQRTSAVEPEGEHERTDPPGVPTRPRR